MFCHCYMQSFLYIDFCRQCAHFCMYCHPCMQCKTISGCNLLDVMQSWHKSWPIWFIYCHSCMQDDTCRMNCHIHMHAARWGCLCMIAGFCRMCFFSSAACAYFALQFAQCAAAAHDRRGSSSSHGLHSIEVWQNHSTDEVQCGRQVKTFFLGGGGFFYFKFYFVLEILFK